MNAIRPLRRLPPASSADLAFGGQLTLWALRLWLSADRGSPALHHTLRTGFTLVRLPTAHIALDQFLSIVVYCNCCMFGVSSLNSRELTSDEKLFLGFLADQQDGAIVTAHQKLVNWISPRDRRLAMAISMEYATLLANNNLRTFHINVQKVSPNRTGVPWIHSGKYH